MTAQEANTELMKKKSMYAVIYNIKEKKYYTSRYSRDGFDNSNNDVSSVNYVVCYTSTMFSEAFAVWKELNNIK